MDARVKLADGMTFVGKASSNHWVVMDGPERTGGSDAGTRPMELILIGLGGCTGMDVVSIMRKKRVPFTRFEIELDSEQANEYPKVFTRIKVKYIVYGKNINQKDVERAIELSETKYCSVTAMLSKTATIESSYEIRDE